MAAPTTRPRASPAARLWAVAVVFVANGVGAPSFLPRLPERQAELGLSDIGLGGVLVGMAAGALAASPLAGRAVGRLGSRAVVVGAALALAASLWTAGAAPTPLLLFGALAVVGAADASMDIAMNANGAAYERRAGGSVMHRLHGAWSLGALAGAGVAAIAAGLGVPLTWQLAGIGAVLAAATLASRRGLVTGDVAIGGGRVPTELVSGLVPSELASPGAPTRTTAEHTADQVPAGETVDGPPAPTSVLAGDRAAPRAAGAGRGHARAVLVVLAAATVGGALIEGTPTDWSAVRLERMGAGPGAAALGLAAFMAGMLAGRLAGDRLTDRYGRVTVLRGGMALAALGLASGALVEHPGVFGLGLVLAGVGASGFFPLAFSAAGGIAGVAPGVGAATVSLAARLGFLVEPLAVGALAEVIGLRWTFAVVAATAVVLAAAAPRIVPSGPRSREG